MTAKRRWFIGNELMSPTAYFTRPCFDACFDFRIRNDSHFFIILFFIDIILNRFQVLKLSTYSVVERLVAVFNLF